MGSEEPLKALEPESELRAEDKKESDSSGQEKRRCTSSSLPCYGAPVKNKKGINKTEEVRIKERECKKYFGDRIYVT